MKQRTNAQLGNPHGIVGAALLALLLIDPAAGEEVREHDWLTIDTPSGGQSVTVRDDGTLIIEFHFSDRGRGPETRTELRLDDDGLPVSLRTTGVNYFKGAVEEEFVLEEGTARWQSAVESGELPVNGPAVYVPANSFPEYSAILARALLAAPGGTLPLLPAGQASIRRVESVELDGRRITLYAISGLGAMPDHIWLDDEGGLYGVDYNWFGVTPKGEARHLPTLKARQEAATDRYLAELAGRLREPLQGLTAITNVRRFDSITGKLPWRPRCTEG